ncbi:aldehyde dehydrogenase family protein, partial [Brevundimonas sp.]|uniref:aldehyde dehydrogenase family protein n=1 Tax=Brevundimonas sp. TaxID=1871086 RepID=UPI001984A483
MTFEFTGKHLIAGEWVTGNGTFASSPAHGPARDFAVGTPDLVDSAARAAEEAFLTYGYSTREERAVFLEAIAEEIDKLGDEITEIGTQETGLP